MAAVFKGYDDIALRLVTAGATPHIQNEVTICTKHHRVIPFAFPRTGQMLAVERHKHDTVVNALLDHVDNPSQLDIQDSVCFMPFLSLLNNR